MIEQQTEYNASRWIYGALRPRIGQRLGIPNRKILKLSFVLEKVNNPVGDIDYVIARTFDNVELYRQTLCDASEIAVGVHWYEMALTVPPTINDEVTIYVEYLGGDGANNIEVYHQNTNVKARENYRSAHPVELSCWQEFENWDCAYKYEYEVVGAPAVVYSIEQLCQNHGMFFGDATTTRLGQKLTIPNRKITHLGFWIWKLANPAGDITFGIRRVSDDGLICSKVWGDASALQGAAAYEEVEFDTPPTINEEVRVYAEFLNGNGVDRTAIRDQSIPIKANEGLTYYTGVWSDFYLGTRECTYRMKNLLLVVASTVITDPATSVVINSAQLNGTLGDDGGEACNVRFQYGETSAYGIDTEWQLGKESVVAFEQAIAVLSPNTTYHFRAQARNSAGTVNGADRTFTTLVATPTVSTDPATNVKETSATLNGTLEDYGGEACEVRFQYGLTTDYGTNTAWQAGKETGDTFSQAIVELVGGNLYHFRAQAKNSAGTANGNDRTLTTITPFMAKRAYALSREEL